MSRREYFALVSSLIATSLSVLVHQAAAEPIDLTTAIDRARTSHDAVRSARLEAEAKALQADALRHLNAPSLSLSGFAGRVATSVNIDTSQLAGAVNPAIGAVDAGTSLDIPPLPTTLSINRVYDLSSLSLSATVPLYTGGRLDAVHGVAKGRALEAQAELFETQEKNASAMAQRYFSAQLAQQAWEVRRAALAGVRQHVEAAAKLERAGLIARADRLKADVALADAERELGKANSDREIALTALTRMLESPSAAEPVTPLFSHSASPVSLQSVIEEAMRNNVAWRRIDAKRDQAEANRHLVGKQFSPTVLGVASYNLNQSSDKLVQPTWFAGVLVRVPLFSPVDKSKSQAAAALEQERVALATRQAERDIPTLAESQWRTMENARVQVLSMAAHLALAKESLRLQKVAFEQSQATALDIIDAELNLAKVQVQRSQAAYDYVMALERLLETTGASDRLPEYARTADVKIGSPLE